jgi:hypothetical protein
VRIVNVDSTEQLTHWLRVRCKFSDSVPRILPL